MNVFQTILLCALIAGGCRFQKNTDLPLSEAVPEVSIELLPKDWNAHQWQVSGVGSVHVQQLTEKKRNQLRHYFLTPTMTPFSIRESGGFEMYRIQGVPSLQDHVFIHPKLFVASSIHRGSILGYTTGARDQENRELITISIPVALVDGIQPAIAVNGGSAQGKTAAVTLPDFLQIPDVEALKQSVRPQIVETLPVCPRSFYLTYEGRQYRAESPFESVCPLNQFFRIQFTAPLEEMRALLEQAAFQTGAVSLITHFKIDFVLPQKYVKLAIDFQQWDPLFTEKLGVQEAYGVQKIESAVTEAFFEASRKAGQAPQYSSEMASYLLDVTERFFTLEVTT